MQPRERLLVWGEAAPWFNAPTPFNPRFDFASLGGRFVALVFLGRAELPASRSFLEAVAGADLPQDDVRVVRFAVTLDARDAGDAGVARAFPAQRVFHDRDGGVAAAYGAFGNFGPEGAQSYRPHWVVLDPNLRVWATGSLQRADAFIKTLSQLPEPDSHAGAAMEPWAPALLIPRVLEPELCKALIRIYEEGQPRDSGFMREEGGKTVGRLDPGFKRRRDIDIPEGQAKEALRIRISSRIVPEIKKAFQFNVSRIERFIVACYDSEDAGFFKAHRDNTTPGTAHRQFAVTLNLNAEEYEGGELRFPEFGRRTYKPPTGGAVVFSCSLLHEATPVTSGRRYATLPFLYDEDGAKIRAGNQAGLVSA
jgi:predicted 2-oxoglutarate/Fe(II)-dependent dioxygenase YbiX